MSCPLSRILNFLCGYLVKWQLNPPVHYYWVSVFPAIGISSICSLISLTSPTPSPTLIRVPLILLNTNGRSRYGRAHDWRAMCNTQEGTTALKHVSLASDLSDMNRRRMKAERFPCLTGYLIGLFLTFARRAARGVRKHLSGVISVAIVMIILLIFIRLCPLNMCVLTRWYPAYMYGTYTACNFSNLVTVTLRMTSF